ncbi:hypothetical protein K2173_002682 [Erythroxylum novogranatense]|uniref:Uncharacterized protein n=1 Tax=Erythroxylum novogranatense TaxID=1862640 RepID=A0AAV8SY00_9ROSI|nr:hypothetical protein K2173_002682 [Erythroxylum novogranatense]
MDTLVLDNPTLVTSFVLFLTVYLFACFVVFRNWGPKHRTEASSSFMSLAHGTPAVVMAIHALLSTQPSPSFASPNSAIHGRLHNSHGAHGLLKLLVPAEITSPCQNVWSIAGYGKSDVAAAAKLYAFLSPPFYTFYTVVRCILGPLLLFEMGLFYLRGAADGLIPGWAWISWIVIIISAILLSMLWIGNHWTNWFREKNSGVQKKLR